jgi:hypothetical protein
MVRVEGIDLVTNFGTVCRNSILKQVRESGAYKEVGTWEQYCISLGFSRRYVDEQIENLEVLGEKFSAQCADLGFGTKDKRILRSAVKDGSLKITDQAVIIDVKAEETGEVVKREVGYKDKEELASLLETIIDERNTEIKAAKAELDAERLTKERHAKQIADLDLKLSQTEAQLKTYKEGKEIGGMPAVDRPDFDYLSRVALELTGLYSEINKSISRYQELSDANQEYLGGVITYMLHLAELLRQRAGVSGKIMDRFYNLPKGVDPIENVLIPGVRNAEGHKSEV